MNYYEVKSWVKNNYPDVAVLDKEDTEINNLVYITSEERNIIASIDFLRYSENKGCICQYETGQPVFYKGIPYQAIVCIFESHCKDSAILTLLHELGHFTECQDGNTLYKEVRAWEGCLKFVNKINIQIDWEDMVRECLGAYESVYPELINNHYKCLKRNLLS